MTIESRSPYKGTILVIDDIPDNLHLLTEMLTQQGYKIRIIPNGQLALKSVANNPPDLILLDIVMPDMDGYQVCQQLKASAKTQNIPVIFLSGLNETLDKVKAFEVGGVDYITKPFQVQEVLARLESQLRLKRLQQQLIQQNIQLQQEIQERQQAEIALSDSEKKYRHLVEASQDLIWSVDCHGNYTFVNPIVRNVYGYFPDEMLGRSFTDFLAPECREADVNLFRIPRVPSLRSRASLTGGEVKTKQVGSGTGLGLSISYQIIVEKHQGQLSCVSTPGEGTTFLIEIPIKPRSQQPIELPLNDMDLAKEIS